MVYMVMSVAPPEDCSALIRDNYIQKTLQTFEDEEEEVDDRECARNIIKYVDDMCGWIPDNNVQYRRRVPQQNEKTSHQQKGPGRLGKTDWDSLSRRVGRHRGGGDTGQQPAIEYEFKHYSNLKKYIEQYRRYHTCGGPLEKLSQSAYGRTKTIYYANDSVGGGGTEAAPVDGGSAEARPSSHHHLPDAPARGSSIIRTYEENPPPSTAPVPRYHSMTDSALRKRAVSLGNYTNHGWSNNIPPGVLCGEPPPQKTTSSNKDSPMQWTINEHGLTIYQDGSKSSPTVFQQKDARPVPGKSSPLPIAGYGSTHHGTYSHLPFFTPSQQQTTTGFQQPSNKQLATPPNVPTNLPVTSGFSIDRTIGISRNSSTGATHDQGTLYKDFYSQLVHAAVHLQITKDKKSALKHRDNYSKLQNNLNLTPFRQNKTCENRTRVSRTRNSRNRESITRESRACESRTRASRARDESSICENSNFKTHVSTTHQAARISENIPPEAPQQGRICEDILPDSRISESRPPERSHPEPQICEARPPESRYSSTSPSLSSSHYSYEAASTCSSNGSSTTSSSRRRTLVSDEGQNHVKNATLQHQNNDGLHRMGSATIQSCKPAASHVNNLLAASHITRPSSDRTQRFLTSAENSLRREVLCRVTSMMENKMELDRDHRVAVCEAVSTHPPPDGTGIKPTAVY